MLSGGTTATIHGVQGGGAQQKTKRARRSFSTTRKVHNVAKSDLEGGLSSTEEGVSAAVAVVAPPLAEEGVSAAVASDTQGCATAPVAPTVGSSAAVAATTFSTPVVTTYAGTGSPGHIPNMYRTESASSAVTGAQQDYSVTTTTAAFSSPQNICIDSSGNIYVSDTGNRVIKVISNGIVRLFAGSANDGFTSPRGIVMDFAAKNLYVADVSCIKKIDVETKSVTLFCGDASDTGFIDGNATTAKFNTPTYIDIDSTGNLYVVDSKNSKVRIVTPSGKVSTPSWNTNIPCPPICVRCGSNGTLVVAAMNGSLYKISSSGDVSVFSGRGALGFSDGPSASSSYNVVSGMILDSANNAYLADTGNNRIRKVDSTGKSTTIMGDGSVGMRNTDKSADPLQTSLNAPKDIAMDRSGNLYIVDMGNHVIRNVAIAPPKADQIMSEITNIHNSIHTDVELLTNPSANPSSVQQGIKNIINGFLRIHSLNIQAMKLYPTLQSVLASSVANLEPNMEALTTSGATVGGGFLQLGGGPLLLDSTLINMPADQLKKKKFDTSPLKDDEVPADAIAVRMARQKEQEEAIQKDELMTATGIKVPKFGFYDKWGPADPSKLHSRVETVLVPLLNNLYAIRKPTIGARENWKRLLFTQGEADFLNDSKVTPGILQEVFSKRYELTINLIDLNSANKTVNSFIQIGAESPYEITFPKEKVTDTRGKLFLYLEKYISDYFDAKDPLEPGVKARIHEIDPSRDIIKMPPITGKPVRITMQLDFPQAFMQKDSIAGLVYALQGRLLIKPITIVSNTSFETESDPSKVSWPVRLADALTKIADGTCRVDYKIAWLNQCRGIKEFIKKIAEFHMKNDDRMRLDTLLTINSMKMLARHGLKTSSTTEPYKYVGIAKLIRAPEREALTEGGVDSIDFSVKYDFQKKSYSRYISLRDPNAEDEHYSTARLIIPEGDLNYRDATALLKKEYAQLLNQNPSWDFYPAS